MVGREDDVRVLSEMLNSKDIRLVRTSALDGCASPLPGDPMASSQGDLPHNSRCSVRYQYKK